MQRDGKDEGPIDEGGEPACSMHLIDDYLEPVDPTPTPVDVDQDPRQ